MKMAVFFCLAKLSPEKQRLMKGRQWEKARFFQEGVIVWYGNKLC